MADTDLACVGIFLRHGACDSLDGRVARMTNTQSAFGEQMDSLSDMVSFGAAPALISYIWALKELGRWGWIRCLCLLRLRCASTCPIQRAIPVLWTSAISKACLHRQQQRWSSGFIWLMTELGFKGTESVWAFLSLGSPSLCFVCRPDHGDQRAFLQLQRCQHEEERAIRSDRSDRFGNCGYQH